VSIGILDIYFRSSPPSLECGMYSLRNPRGMCRFAAATMVFEKRLYALEHAGMNYVTWFMSIALASDSVNGIRGPYCDRTGRC
jgi:hypothetical protein